ncbi:hypothetical protein NDU88_001881 [Pleurodeles waltl]|uniref:Uncharacterized protein n=1 Tax=Pleurodeles waltl TaxID=8319 RepID=A0AAV7KZR3_PLEWA|nr:hypothetical protein NDU88_001881 [Pleurodeles waltl]
MLPRLRDLIGAEQVEVLESRLDDAEGWLRHKNVRMVGLPKGAKGSDAVTYVKQWLRQLLLQDTFSQFFLLECAHRKRGQSKFCSRYRRKSDTLSIKVGYIISSDDNTTIYRSITIKHQRKGDINAGNRTL